MPAIASKNSEAIIGEHTVDNYEEACKASEMWVTIPDKRVLTDIRFKLRYSEKHRGRALVQRYELPNGQALEVGDRLEPSRHLPDVGDLHNLDTPALVLFWRARPGDRLSHGAGWPATCEFTRAAARALGSCVGSLVRGGGLDPPVRPKD